MALEKTIEDLIAAIKEQTVVQASLVAAINALRSGNGVVPVQTVVEKPVQATVQTTAEEPSYKLPDGTRDMAYYQLHIMPHTAALVKKDKDRLITIVKSFGVESGKAVPVDKWDEFHTRVRLALDGLPA